jgi:O-antigen/teichoic acid export membrane protein
VDLLHRILKSPFVRNVAVLSSGTILAQVITALATPVLSRIYGPAEFGILALFLSILAVSAEAVSARYESAVVLPKDDDDGANVLALACLVVLFTSLLSIAGVALFGRALAHRLDSPELAGFLWWIPLALFSVGIFRSLGQWATRKKQFPTISVTQVVRSIVIAVIQIASGIAGIGASGLIGGRVAGEVSGTSMLWVRMRDGMDLRRRVSWKRMKELAREYSDFPKFSLPQGVLNAFSQSIAAFLLVFFFDEAIVGIYAMSHRVLVLPMRLLSSSVRQVFLQRASETRAHGGSVYPLLLKTTLGLASVVILPVLVLILLGPQLFGFVLGPEWVPAGEYARWMAVWLFFVYLNPPTIVLTQVLRKNHYLLIYDIALFICRSLTLVIGGLNYGPLTVVAAFSLVGAVFNASLIVFMHLVSRRQP